ncbi:MAG TPA: GNAT family N-acetyltransferase [Candidatus Avipropionibacterium avicola]|uniref:GNAT family N-acetyltransferase n=1 Tax=Candidatus Avipropionibacterium avicola TaxID=2840701 RepID=A0A9D1H0K3_9ACTN|nr:GNAT family N-acetyltransferase [Candidatus Avipropionibacterium avicola]
MADEVTVRGDEAALRRAHDTLRRRQWRAEQRAGEPPTAPREPSGLIWTWDDDESWLWCLERSDSTDEAILAGLVCPVQQVAAIWQHLHGIGGPRGWRHLSHSVFTGDPVAEELARLAPHQVVATKLQLDVTDTPPPQGVRMTAMDPQHFAAFRERSIEMYVEQAIDSGAETDPSRARTLAEQLTDQALPQGVDTSDEWVCELHRGDEVVGDAWLSRQGERLFLYDIMVREDLRGQGIGTQALRACADLTRRIGPRHLALNVFGSNPRAQQLYLREGFTVTERIIQLDLSSPED